MRVHILSLSKRTHWPAHINRTSCWSRDRCWWRRRNWRTSNRLLRSTPTLRPATPATCMCRARAFQTGPVSSCMSSGRIVYLGWVTSSPPSARTSSAASSRPWRTQRWFPPCSYQRLGGLWTTTDRSRVSKQYQEKGEQDGILLLHMQDYFMNKISIIWKRIIDLCTAHDCLVESVNKHVFAWQWRVCISVCGVNLWNNLGVEFKQSININHFKKHI